MKFISFSIIGAAVLAAPCSAQLPDWTQVNTTAAPASRLDHGMVYDSVRKQTVLFGGSSGSGETWEYNGTNWTQKSPTTSPTPRDVPAMAFDAGRGVTVIFGGVDGLLNVLRDVWEYNGTTWTKIKIPALFKPSARSRSAMEYDSVRKRIVLFGGFDTVLGTVNDTWEYNGAIWNKISTVTSPPARDDHGMAYDPIRKKIVMYGGQSSSDLGDTWEYDGTNWTQMSPTTSPPAMHGVELTYDTKRKKVILFGGHGSAVFNTTWEWDGTTWASINTVTKPATREQHAIAHDSSRGKTIIFSGTNGSSDTWEYSGGGCILTTDVPSISVATGGTQTLTVEALAHPNKLYWIFGSVSGTSPGISLLGVTIPLNPDLYTNFTIAFPTTPPLTNFRSLLDVNGKATAKFTLPAAVLTATFTMHHAAVVINSAGGFDCASNAASLEFK